MTKIKISGESIIEVLVSTIILVIILTTVFVLIHRGIATETNVKKRIQAINIAREGIEAVRNIRDTNWLKYSGDRRGKWLCLDELASWVSPQIIQADCGSVGGAGNIAEGFYIVDFSEDFKRYFLQEMSAATELDLSNELENFEDFRIFSDSINNRLTHQSTGNISTPFYRQIYINPISQITCGVGGCKEEKINVVSRVQWRENNIVRKVVLEAYLYDFFERNEY